MNLHHNSQTGYSLNRYSDDITNILSLKREIHIHLIPRRQPETRSQTKLPEPSPSHKFCYLCKTLYRVVRKFFPLDKNYVLEETQLRVQDRLLTELIALAKAAYQTTHNPLGLNDSFSEKINRFDPQNLKPLYSFYQNLAGIYRYKYGENQLGFLWDGKDHSEKYREDWSHTFRQWTGRLCHLSQFVQAVLDLSVFLPQNRQAHLAENRMNAVTLGLFEVKIHKSRGIVEMKVA